MKSLHFARHGISKKPEKEKNLTPGKAIRKFCLACVGSASEVKNCCGDQLLTDGQCNFFEYRVGKGRPSVKGIRQECLFCMGGSRKLVNECKLKKCPLHKFRMGTNPNFAGKVGTARLF